MEKNKKISGLMKDEFGGKTTIYVRTYYILGRLTLESKFEYIARK